MSPQIQQALVLALQIVSTMFVGVGGYLIGRYRRK